MRRWLTTRLVERTYAALRRGDPEPALRMFRPDGRFRFPGDSSWGIDTTDPAERRTWFERFAALDPNIRVRDVVVSGPPWLMAVCVVFDDRFTEAGETVYENHGVQYLQLRWGRIAHDELNLDTQRVAEYDAREPA